MIKTYYFVVLLSCILSSIAYAQQRDTIYVSDRATTHIIFGSDLTYVDISDKVVAAKLVGTNKNILALKAASGFDFMTTVSAMESNGVLHTFVVKYGLKHDQLIVDIRCDSIIKSNEKYGGTEEPKDMNASLPGIASKDPSVETYHAKKTPSLSDVAKGKQRIYHIGKSQYGIMVLLTDLFVVNDITYMVLEIANKSGISYDASSARFVIESKKKTKRSIEYERPVFAKSRFGSTVVAPGASERVAFTFDKITLTKDQILALYLYETGGSRNIIIRINYIDINSARRP